MASATGLAEAQRRFQHAILAPHGPGAEAGELLTASARLSAAQRLEVYRRGYRLRLLEAMRGLHPGLRALLGQELFDEFALDYLDACPSRSHTLSELNRRFTAHLAAHRPDRDRPPRLREAWIDVLIDLAHYERVFAEVYDGPGIEHLQPGQGARTFADGTVRPAPCLRVLTLCAPVHSYVASVRRGRPAEAPRPGTVRLAVSRRDFVVTTTELASGAHRFLSALLEGVPVPTAAAAADLARTEAERLLKTWAAVGWLLPCQAPHHPGPEETV
ncbi:HvfC/BufC family peptide modification chaperone [Kitasatospora sp. HPMI-4]|uniref:HvfC/BufC family peptide modification chaperone n=1 Tax=Kitasatospora sp. HPMI-4 TaxID=3448443 RepID=UPI003F1C08A6